MKEILLTQGKVALVDDALFEKVNAFKWCAMKHRRRWAAGRAKRGGKRSTQYMHQFLLPGVPEIDHRDGNALNNQMHNIRPATNTQNQRGFKRKRISATSKYRGVSWKKDSGKWQAEIQVNGKGIYLGLFTLETDAAKAYDAAARKYYTDGFLHLNFP